MDTTLIKQLGYEILSYRIQSQRTKKRKRRNDSDKRLLRKSRELDALYEQKSNLGWEPVHPPYQKGWKRYFILKADVRTGKKADFFQNLLNKINTTQYSWKKQFTVKRKKFGRKIFIPKVQYLQTFSDWQLQKLHLSAAEQSFFLRETIVDKHGKAYFKYVFAQPWRFQLTVQPHMIDKRRKLDIVLEAEINFIHHYMNTRNLYPYLTRLEKGNFKYKGLKEIPKAKYIRFMQKHSIAEWSDIILNEMI